MFGWLVRKPKLHPSWSLPTYEMPGPLTTSLVVWVATVDINGTELTTNKPGGIVSVSYSTDTVFFKDGGSVSILRTDWLVLSKDRLLIHKITEMGCFRAAIETYRWDDPEIVDVILSGGT